MFDMASVASSRIRLRRRERCDDPADLPVYRWADAHDLDPPETSAWRPREETSWVKDILRWAEQDAQEQNGDSEENLAIELRNSRNRRQGQVVEGGSATRYDVDVAYWAYAIREMLKDVHCEVDGIEGATLFG